MAHAALGSAMRKLWSDHVIWTRLYIMAAVADKPDPIAKLPEGVRTAAGEKMPAGVFQATGPALGEADAAAGRLLKNQEDIGEAIVPFYGKDNGNKLTGILKEHIMIAVELVNAAKANDDKKFAEYDRKWDDNARQIAKFLSGANPNWPEAAVYDLLDQHLRLTKGEVVARIKKDWAADIKAFDDIFTEILVLADTLTRGLVAQFPDRFPDAQAEERLEEHA